MTRFVFGCSALACVAVTIAAAGPLEVPFIEQRKNGCGAASVSMLLRYWGQTVDVDVVYTELGGGSKEGIALSEMKRYLDQSGFRAFTLRGNWADLEKHLEKRRPLIVALRPGESKPLHFAVVAGIDGERVWLNDPTRKKTATVDRERFEKQWGLGDRWLLVATPARSQ